MVHTKSNQQYEQSEYGFSASPETMRLSLVRFSIEATYNALYTECPEAITEVNQQINEMETRAFNLPADSVYRGNSPEAQLWSQN